MIVKFISDQEGTTRIVEGTSVFIKRLDDYLDVTVEPKRQYPDIEVSPVHHCIRNTRKSPELTSKDEKKMWDYAFVMEDGKTIDRIKF